MFFYKCWCYRLRSMSSPTAYTYDVIFVRRCNFMLFRNVKIHMVLVCLDCLAVTAYGVGLQRSGRLERALRKIQVVKKYSGKVCRGLRLYSVMSHENIKHKYILN